jgi:hypothetical protein
VAGAGWSGTVNGIACPQIRTQNGPVEPFAGATGPDVLVDPSR